MFCFLVVVFVSLWHASSCQNATLCVARGREREAECQIHDVTNIIHRLSDITLEITSCDIVRIYLTSGTHVLNETIEFGDSVEETKIEGASHGQPSIIECEKNAGIKFSGNGTSSMVLLSNIVLTHCQTRINEGNTTIPAALYFKNVLYTLNNLVVKNSSGHGIIVYDCKEQFISNCTFRNNSNGHIKISSYLNPSKVSIKVNGTKFYEGKSKLASGGLCFHFR